MVNSSSIVSSIQERIDTLITGGCQIFLPKFSPLHESSDALSVKIHFSSVKIQPNDAFFNIMHACQPNETLSSNKLIIYIALIYICS